MPKEPLYLEIDPVPAPRQVRSDTWDPSPSVLRYRAFRDTLRYLTNRHQYVLGDELHIEFFLAMPPSWSKKKREAMYLKPHQQKPDTDNLVKAFCDAMTDEDSGVWHIDAAKYWSEKGGILIK